MIRRVDEEQLRRIVGPLVMQRGMRYAATGRVVRCEWDADGLRAVGEVAGSSPSPYLVAVQLTRRPDATLGDVEARCTCPVGFNCKHAVAVLLAQQVAAPALRVLPPPGSAAPPVDWEEPLWALLATGLRSAERALSEGLGLQFELVAARAALRGRAATRAPGIRLRPVVRSPAGNWVRSELTWNRLDHGDHGRPGSTARARQVGLLKELRALHRAGTAEYWYGTGDEPVWLESISSRRLWDLLRHAGEEGLVLLSAGRDATAVDLRPDPVQASLEVTASGPGLTLRPELRSAGATVTPSRSLLIGSPAHGVAWWDRSGEGIRTPPLHMAPLSQPLEPAAADLLRAGDLTVPPAGVERFTAVLYPRLTRHLPVRSSDGSVELPEPTADTVVLSVRAAPGPALDLAWALEGAPGARRELSAHPDARAVAALAAAVGVADDHPDLLVAGPGGPRLAPSSRLGGLAAARFAAEGLPRLDALDGVVVERHDELPDFREVAEAPVVRFGGEESPAGDWFDLQVEVSVDGEEVPFADLFVALAEEASHLLLPSGAYFALDRPELRSLAALIAEARSLDDHPGRHRGRTVRLSRWQASLWEDLQELGAVDAQAGAWAGAVAALAGAVASSGGQPLPAGLLADLRPYQVEGFQWLAARYQHRLGGILADDMGLGKTLAALALVCHSREAGLTDAPWLVVAPTSVVGNWAAEAARFAPSLPVVAITETTRRRGRSLAEATAGAGLVVTSYALFRLEFDGYEALPWAGLVLDEAQFAKNPASHNHQRARRLPVPFKLAMTGTPLENSLAELWALTAIVAPGLFSRAERFAEVYRTPIERHGDAARLDQLRRRIRPIMLRRTKEQVASDLPDKQEQVLELELHPRHAKLYQTYLQRERQKILGLLGDLDGNRFEIFRSLTLLRQAALDVALVDPAHASVPSTKLDALTDMLGGIVADGHRVLVFSQFTRFLTAARHRIEDAGIETSYLDGRTTKRASVIEGFREGRTPVFLISLKAGGFGLNLTEADYCILLDPWWNPATEAQAVDRAHRIGQTRKVMVYRLVARDTIEEKVMALKARKATLFDSVVGGGGFESAALTAGDLRELLG